MLPCIAGVSARCEQPLAGRQYTKLLQAGLQPHSGTGCSAREPGMGGFAEGPLMQADGTSWSSMQQSKRCLDGLTAHLDSSGINVADG